MTAVQQITTATAQDTTKHAIHLRNTSAVWASLRHKRNWCISQSCCCTTSPHTRMLGLPSWEQSVKKATLSSSSQPTCHHGWHCAKLDQRPHTPATGPASHTSCHTHQQPISCSGHPKSTSTVRSALCPSPHPVHYSMWQGWQRIHTAISEQMHACNLHTSHVSLLSPRNPPGPAYPQPQQQTPQPVHSWFTANMRKSTYAPCLPGGQGWSVATNSNTSAGQPSSTSTAGTGRSPAP